MAMPREFRGCETGFVRSTRRFRYSTKAGPLAPEIGAAGRGRAFLFLAEIDASAREIVGRDFHDDPIADPGADAEFAHLARHVREDLVLIVERDAIIAVRQHLGHGAAEFEQLFFGHPLSSIRCGLPSAFRRHTRSLTFPPSLRSDGAAEAQAGYCTGVSPPAVFLASSISVAATRISARVLRSGASKSACFSAVP